MRIPVLCKSCINVFWINSSKYLLFFQTAYEMSPSSPTTRDWSICWSGEPSSASPTSSLSGLPNVLSARLQDVVSRTLRNGIKSCCMPKKLLILSRRWFPPEMCKYVLDKNYPNKDNFWIREQFTCCLGFTATNSAKITNEKKKNTKSSIDFHSRDI